MNSSTVLIIAMVCVTVGYLAGVVVSKLGSGRPKAPKPPTKPAKEPRAGQPVAQFTRDADRGQLIVHVEGKSFHSAVEMSSSTRQEMEALTVEIHKWLGYQPAATDHPPVATPPTQKATPTPAAPNPIKLIGLPTGTKPVQATPLPKSIVEQIDEILQANIKGTPYAEQHLRLMETPNRGVAVEIGMDRYDGIDAVPDDQVRSLIRAAVAEWELVAK